MNIKNCNEKMGSSCLFTRQRALKMGSLYRLCVKNWNHLLTELSLGYPKNKKFYLKSKASFIDTSSIASFKLFLIAWLQQYCTFSDSSVVSLKSWLGQNTSSRELFSKNKLCSTIKLFSSWNMFFIRLFLANTWKKPGVTLLVQEKRRIYFAIELTLR